jgi:ABC-type transport system substrate-binding protein
MEVSLRDIRRVNTSSLFFTLVNWRKTLSAFEKATIAVLLAFVILTSWRWAVAASQYRAIVPNQGGVFVEGVTGESIDNIDLGRLNKAALVKTDPSGQIAPDLATKWEVNPEKDYYKFTLVPSVAAYDLTQVFEKNPTYLNGAMPEVLDNSTLGFKLDAPDSGFLSNLSRPIFPYGPYVLDKKTKNEIRLKFRKGYHLSAPYIERFIIRVYPDAAALQKAADKGKINGVLALGSAPKNFNETSLILAKRHIVFVNSSKTYLKKTAVREKILKGEKPDSVNTLDILEVNGISQEKDFTDLKEKLQAAGIDVKVRQVSIKDALLNDLPKRNYDLLYIVVDEGLSGNPYKLWNSSQRSSDGQNFAELANADVDNRTEEYIKTEDQAKKTELLGKINELIAKEKVATIYPNIQEKYYISTKVKGFALSPISLSETDRFNLESLWYFNEKKLR